jgi:hypothetical protein
MQTASARRLAGRAATALAVMLTAVAAQAQSANPRVNPPLKEAIDAVRGTDLGSGAAQGLALRLDTWEWPTEHAVATLPARPYSPSPRLTQQPARDSRSARIAKRIVGGVVGGGGGFLVGGLVGSKLEPSCGCDDPGLRGFLIGAPIGAVLGAVAGVMSVR